MMTIDEEKELNEQLVYEQRKHAIRKLYNEAPVYKIIEEYNAYVAFYDTSEPTLYKKTELFTMLNDIQTCSGTECLINLIVSMRTVNHDSMFYNDTVAYGYNGEEIEWFTEQELRDYLLKSDIVEKTIKGLQREYGQDYGDF